MASTEELSGSEKTVFGIASLLIVAFSGVCSGLTVGIFSLDPSRLEVMTRAGATSWQRNSAGRLLFLVKNGHWTLVTLLVSNASAMSALPLVLDRLVSAELAVVLSITAVLVFGEVVPQALFVRYGFSVCAVLVPLMWVLMLVTAVISYPAAMLLDAVVGHQARAGRDEIEKHVRIVEDALGADGGAFGDESLLPEEIQVMRGALSLGKKTLRDVRGVDQQGAFMLAGNAPIDQAMVERIVSEGYSRVPVCLNQDRTHVIGVLLTKSLLTLAYTLGPDAPASAAPRVSDLPLREPFRVQEDTKVSDLLQSFKTGKSHLACVYNKSGSLVKFVTLDDIFQLLSGQAEKPQQDSQATQQQQQTRGGAAASSSQQALSPRAAGPPSAAAAQQRPDGSLPPGADSTLNITSSTAGNRDALVASTFAAIRQSNVR
jgi:metal transporter CNNM